MPVSRYGVPRCVASGGNNEVRPGEASLAPSLGRKPCCASISRVSCWLDDDASTATWWRGEACGAAARCLLADAPALRGVAAPPFGAPAFPSLCLRLSIWRASSGLRCIHSLMPSTSGCFFICRHSSPAHGVAQLFSWLLFKLGEDVRSGQMSVYTWPPVVRGENSKRAAPSITVQRLGPAGISRSRDVDASW